VKNVEGKEFKEIVDQYVVTFTIDGEFVTINVYDTFSLFKVDSISLAAA
jgi:hypothetical protein